jgi:prevent-host-death family protein
MTQTLNASNVRSNWSQILNDVFRGQKEVLVEKSGIPVAALVSAQDYKTLQQIRKQRQKDFDLIAQMRANFKDQTPEEIQSKTAKAIKQVRKENQSSY